MIPQKFAIPLFFELEKERARTHQWIKIAKPKGVEDVGHMEEKLQEMGRELSSIRDREKMMKSQLEAENTWLRKQLQEKEGRLATMASLSMEAIQCRMPTKSYALHLIEKWMQFYIKTLAQRGTMPFQDYGQFIDLYDQSTLEDRANISEFYLHNLALTYLNVWDPNPKLGEFQLMVLASWMSHEEARATKMKRVLAREEVEPLFIRVEQPNSMVVINTHNLIANDPKLAPRYHALQEQEITHFEYMLRFLGDESQQVCQRRWNTLTYNLKIKEYHSPDRIRDALERVPMYKQTL